MITPGQQALASDFIATSAGAGSSGKVPKLNAGGKLDNSFLPVKFGGTGADGALATSSGTTTINLGGASAVVMNYTSISITGTGVLAFSNPSSNGTIVILKSQGNVTITSSSNPAIDLRNMGAAGGTNGSGTLVYATTGAGSGVPGVGAHASGNIYGKCVNLFCGAGGGGGANPGGGAGGRGGGGIYIECGGALNITSTINTSGSTGSNGGGNGSSWNNNWSGGGGGGSSDGSGGGNGGTSTNGAGGGGGGGGAICIVYASLTANSGAYTNGGGSGGSGVATGGAGGSGYSMVVANTEFN